MNRPSKFPATTASPLLHGGDTAGADGSPVSAPATFPCPECEGTGFFVSGAFHPDDPRCEATWDCDECEGTGEVDYETPSPRISNQPTYEEAVALIAEVFGPKPVSNGSWRIEL